MHPYVLAVTGASAQPLAERTLQLLLKAGRSVHLVLSKGAYAVFKAEQGLTIPMEPNRQAAFWRERLACPDGDLVCHRWNDQREHRQWKLSHQGDADRPAAWAPSVGSMRASPWI